MDGIRVLIVAVFGFALVSADDLSDLTEKLYILDQQNGALSGTWAVNTYSTNGKLFTKYDNKTLYTRPNYKALIDLLDNYEPCLGVAEKETAQEQQEQSKFLDIVCDSAVMKEAWKYLQKKFTPSVLGAATPAGCKAFLSKIWFTLYKRKGVFDTSGFEHVFIGELKGCGPTDDVDGLHNWVNYVLEEAAGRIQYVRYKGNNEPDLYGMTFKWKGHTKIKSTIQIGESPEMSMAILTTCFMMNPNAISNIKMGGAPVQVQSYRWDNRNNGDYYVASAYYDN